ncbi:TetR family transcriptional regulator [Roseovarius spongiae]|uniref:TetR family transcriptional regulator n=1 Tax=Roseovarius spongiae TaxID=2320272 RepID=A0A3A8AWJ4_9RHOB|nr:TetR family transcriptional regulator C-terminal domain-containing protein [Roseovarius spongiae]RKF16733.1 TetR family transcriptional regulator [Roseovarius spongiae]
MSQAQQKPRKERKENAERRRRQLLDAARRSILAHGLARTTLATVAAEAGLSQGVAVFYFQSKGGLLTETLRDLYAQYDALWSGALERAGEDPVERLRAIIRADFHADACGPDILPLWFAFWGELRSTPEYDAVAAGFDARRRAALIGVWQALMADAPAGEAGQMADWMETLTDGYWQRLHLAPESFERAAAERASRVCIARLHPPLAGRIDRD